MMIHSESRWNDSLGSASRSLLMTLINVKCVSKYQFTNKGNRGQIAYWDKHSLVRKRYWVRKMKSPLYDPGPFGLELSTK